MKHLFGLAFLAAVCFWPVLSVADEVLVSELKASQGDAGVNEWYTFLRGGGTGEIVDLGSTGSGLAAGQPAPPHAVRLTTGFDNADGADVITAQDFGSAATVLTSIDLSYSYYKATVAGGNTTAAPSLKLGIGSATGTGDNFGQLIYEPNWNQPSGGSTPPPTDAWQEVLIDETTGSGDDATGGWWWSGGFEVGSSAGGPPIRSLSEWAAIFAAADPDFTDARVVSLGFGVGTFNQGQLGYVDQVSIQTGGIDYTYNFVPEPASLVVFALGLPLACRRRRAR